MASPTRIRTTTEDEDDDEDGRWPLLSFANTDMAFAGDVLVVGNYHGFNIYRLATRACRS